jgi:hypothetical protein
MRVPILTRGATNGGVQIWVSMHGDATLGVGLDGPDGTWISPVDSGQSAGKNTSDYNAAVYNGSAAPNSPVPQQSHGAVVVWQNKWPSGTYYVTLSGSGTADLYLQATGDAGLAGSVGFAHGVREGTINLPATSPAILSVGCTINKRAWRNVRGSRLGLSVPILDATGGLLDPRGMTRDPNDGEPCWFSSAGPTLAGIPKPEIMAPGAAIVGAMSRQAAPPSASSIFTNPLCPAAGGGTDPACQQVDTDHAASFGTSFSAPIVSGAVALLFQQDPTLTQDAVIAAIQGGAHPLRGAAAYQDQAGPGEVDVAGALLAANRMRIPQTALPVRAQSWMTLGADTYLADGSTPLAAIVELRTARPAGAAAAPPADGFAQDRLVLYALVNGVPFPDAVTSLVRRGPGVWLATLELPAGMGGSKLTVGATFDGIDIVQPKSIPIATDAWDADYPSRVHGGCAVADGRGGAAGALLLAAACALARRRRRLT